MDLLRSSTGNVHAARCWSFFLVAALATLMIRHISRPERSSRFRRRHEARPRRCKLRQRSCRERPRREMVEESGLWIGRDERGEGRRGAARGGEGRRGAARAGWFGCPRRGNVFATVKGSRLGCGLAGDCAIKERRVYSEWRCSALTCSPVFGEFLSCDVGLGLTTFWRPVALGS
jgi:hypothetical protein